MEPNLTLTLMVGAGTELRSESGSRLCTSIPPGLSSHSTGPDSPPSPAEPPLIDDSPVGLFFTRIIFTFLLYSPSAAAKMYGNVESKIDFRSLTTVMPLRYCFKRRHSNPIGEAFLLCITRAQFHRPRVDRKKPCQPCQKKISTPFFTFHEIKLIKLPTRTAKRSPGRTSSSRKILRSIQPKCTRTSHQQNSHLPEKGKENLIQQLFPLDFPEKPTEKSMRETHKRGTEFQNSMLHFFFFSSCFFFPSLLLGLLENSKKVRKREKIKN